MPVPGRATPLSERTRALLRPLEHLMGQRPDGEIATAAGLDRRNVVIYRQSRGIPAYDRLGRRPAPPATGQAAPGGGRRSRLDAFAALMGSVPDGQIALLAACSREAVMRYRSRRGIAAAPRSTARARAGREDPAPARTAHGYVVTAVAAGEHREYVVIGDDIAEAARVSLASLARRSPGAEVLELRHHGALLG